MPKIEARVIREPLVRDGQRTPTTAQEAWVRQPREGGADVCPPRAMPRRRDAELRELEAVKARLEQRHEQIQQLRSELAAAPAPEHRKQGVSAAAQHEALSADDVASTLEKPLVFPPVSTDWQPVGVASSNQNDCNGRERSSMIAKPQGIVRRFVNHLYMLRRNGTLVQAMGVPLRHVLALAGLMKCLRGEPRWQTYAFAFLLWPISGFGITAGAHRLWTHQTYVPSRLMEVMLVIMYSIADQGPISGWALTHTLHHRASDTPLDPHNRNAGFWYAHFGWLFSSQSYRVRPEDYNHVVGRLSNLVHWHDACYTWWDPLWSHAMPMLISWLWGQAMAGFLVAGALRWAIVQHVTFSVNSIAHGEREEDDQFAFDAKTSGIGPRVSLLVTVVALGEGWHDYHHLFPWDYAAAELDAWDQWNPTKVFIDVCFNLGLCHGRRRCSTELQKVRRQNLLSPEDKDKSLAPKAFTTVGWPFLRCRVPVKDPCASVKGS